MTLSFRVLAVALSIAVLCVSAPVRAERMSAPLEAAIHLRALSYDRALKKRAGDSVVIAILYDPASESSVQSSDEMRDALISLSKKVKVQDLPFVVKSVAYTNAWPTNDLAAASVVYVTRGLEGRLNEIRAQTVKHGIRTLCGDRDLARQGLAVAVYVNGTSPGLTINLAAARSAGMDLDSRLLAIAEVLK
jgi:hypothetical protein